MVAFVAVFALTLLAELIANDRPLLLKYDGKLYFPVFAEYTEQEFGGRFSDAGGLSRRICSAEY